MAEVENWFEDVFNAARQLLLESKQATGNGQGARADSRLIAEQSGRYADEVMRAIRWLESEGWLKARYRGGAYSDAAEVYWVKEF